MGMQVDRRQAGHHTISLKARPDLYHFSEFGCRAQGCHQRVQLDCPEAEAYAGVPPPLGIRIELLLRVCEPEKGVSFP